MRPRHIQTVDFSPEPASDCSNPITSIANGPVRVHDPQSMMVNFIPGARAGDSCPPLDEWDLWMRAASMALRTRTERRRIVLQIARMTGEDPTAFTPGALLTFFASVEGASSRLTYFRAAQAWHRWLVEMGIRADDPTTKLPRPREPRRRPRPITTVGLERLLVSGIRRRTRAMVLLAAHGGLRVHEIAKVRGEDVDWDARTLRVVGKGGRERWQPLTPVLLEVAAAMPRSGWWFPSHKHPDAHVRRESVSSTISRAMDRCGVVGTAHQARHWLGTTALATGTDVRVVQELLGHERLATTELYVAVADEARHAAVARLPGLN
jgi:integrase/recombinase XerD